MKKLIYILIGATALMACSKESIMPVKETLAKEGQYAVTVYFDDITKASINSSTGKFEWTGDEKIAIWDSNHKEFVTFNIASYSNEGNKQARFTTNAAQDGASFVGNAAYYPASIATKDGESPSYTFPTNFTSLEDAAKGFPMEGTVSSGEIHFSHLGALINITLNNVPSFTTALILNDGTNDITVAATPTAGVINAVVPIPAGNYVLTAKLKDNNNNIFYSKARTSKTYSARNYYSINPITLGYLLTFTNEAGWASPKVHLWQTGNDSNNTDITTGGTYPHKLYLRNTNMYYVLLDGNVETWTANGNAIGVQFYSNESQKTQTDFVSLLRNIDFTIPAGGGMKAVYRIYVYMADEKWSDWIRQGTGTNVVKFTTWEGLSTPDIDCIQTRSLDNKGYVFYHEFPDTEYGKTTVKYRFYNERNGSWESKDESGIIINKDTWAKDL